MSTIRIENGKAVETWNVFDTVKLYQQLGYRWKLLVALAIEVVPVIQVFPAWTLMVLTSAATENNDVLKKLK